MRAYRIRKVLVAASTGLLAITGAAVWASGQNYDHNYREWQKYQQTAETRCAEYRRTGNRSDSRACQRAQADAQRYYLQMQRAGNVYNRRTPGSGMYRIYRNGSYYNVDSRGVSLLRQAVNSGYQQGYQQGRVDKQRSRRYDFNGNNMYISGTYGYQSYVARDQYQYYFQQGFQRGYEDGYNNTYRYGSRSGNTYNILSNVLGTILNLATQQ